MTDPRYPIGKFSYTGPLTADQKKQCLDNIEQTPARLREAVRGLSDTQLDTPYRDGGWTVRQVVHHVPDSHMNAYIRFKLGADRRRPNHQALHGRPLGRTARLAPAHRELTRHARFAAQALDGLLRT